MKNASHGAHVNSRVNDNSNIFSEGPSMSPEELGTENYSTIIVRN